MAHSSSAKKLFLVDGSAVAYRAFYAFDRNPLVNSRGENVGAVYGFTTIILNLLDDEKPDYFAVVFDTPAPTFRHDMYEQYKAHRKAMPDDMVGQLPQIDRMLELLKIPVISRPGYEADDILGTLAKIAEKKNIETVIVSGDKDLLQLVSDKTVVLKPRQRGGEAERLDENGVVEKMGVLPGKIIDFLALTGDSSDNIPGVEGIGPVGAVKLLQEFGSLENILDSVDKVSNKKHKESLKRDVEKARLSKVLATIKCDVGLDVEPEELIVGQYDADDVVSFFRKLEFMSLIDRFSERKQEPEKKYHLVDDEEKFNEFLDKISQQRAFAFDTETTDVDPMRAELVGLSFSWIAGEAYYIPVKGPEMASKEKRLLPPEKVLAALKPLLENEGVKKCGHNAKYDILVLSQHGIEVKGLDFDTMVASYLINPSARQHNIDAVSLEHLNIKKIPTSDLLGSGKNQVTMDLVPVEKVAEYACEDADVAWRLEGVLSDKLKKLDLYTLFKDVEIPLIDVLKQMEQNGVALNLPYLAEMSVRLGEKLATLEQDIYRVAGHPFNINSPKQLSTVLFEELKLPSQRKTKTGYSTDVTVLEELAKVHQLPVLLLDYRQLTKLKSTYVDTLPKLVNPKTGHVHTSYNQTVAATGRLSSSDPNLQNIPIRTEIGRSIRKAFVPSDASHVILDADYSQVELRIMAHLSKDATLSESFLHDEDVHTRTAALVFGVEPQNVTSDQRRKAKEVNFGIMYGMGAFGLSQRLGLAPQEADEFIQAYFAFYPGVRDFMTRIINEAREKGYVTTILNRRRYLPEINSDNRNIREFAERTAINTPIQGSAADLIKVAMIRIHRKLQAGGYRAKMILQVHDELVFDVPKNELNTVEPLVRHEMENAFQLDVPLKVDTGSADNWLDAH